MSPPVPAVITKFLCPPLLFNVPVKFKFLPTPDKEVLWGKRRLEEIVTSEPTVVVTSTSGAFKVKSLPVIDKPEICMIPAVRVAGVVNARLEPRVTVLLPAFRFPFRLITPAV
jgi:hypothetical protein